MKIARSFLRLVILAVALSALAVSQAHASCTGSDQVSHSDAQCLTATQTNGVLSVNWSVTHACSAYGTVVAKIDFSGSTADQTVTLNSSNTTQSGTAAGVDGIYCCKDLGDLCNRSDVVTSANCSSEFDSSPAAGSCSTRAPTVNSDHTTCSFTVRCGGWVGDYTIAYTDMDDLRYCTDSLTTESSCPGL